MIRIKPVELVESIQELILFNWEQLNIKGGEKWIFKNKEDWGRKVDPERIEKKYFQLHDEYAEATGGSRTIEKIMILMVKRLEARVLVGAGDKSAKNLVNLYSEMINRLMEGGGEVDIIKTRLQVQQAYGMPIDPHKTTVAEFIKIMDIVKDQANKRTRQIEQNG